MPDRKHILIVDDERDLAEVLTFNLAKAGYDTSVASTGRQALAAIQARIPDLIILDVMLPEYSGTDIAARVRTNPATAAVPILMLTAKAQDADQVAGLTAGADDYVTKPFSMKVLLARVEALLRRATHPGAPEHKLVRVGPIAMNADTHEISVDNEPIKLTLTEFRLLAALMQAGGKVLSRAVLIARAMGPGVTITDRTIDVHMTAIRKRLGAHAPMIKTVRGVGYRLTTEAGEE